MTPAMSVDAVVFDLDGVLTDTAELHAAAWKATFDELLARRAKAEGHHAHPFSDDDYRRYVDGRARHDGIRSFLASRAIELPEGEPADAPSRETVWGLANGKNRRFLRLLAERGIRPFDSSVRLVRRLRARGLRTAVISASRNCAAILEAGGIADLFDVKVDGTDAAALGLAGKPDPAVFLEAARRLGSDPRRTAIVEDSLAGVEAGARGEFGMVVGVDRAGYAEDLRRSGATHVVSDLAEIAIAD